VVKWTTCTHLALTSIAAVWTANAIPSVTALARFRSAIFPKLHGIGNEDHVAITFDDGPDPLSTPAFLNELDRLKWRATFFVLAERVLSWPYLLKEMVDAGHEVAVHGLSHKVHLLSDPFTTTQEMKRAKGIIEEVGGISPKWFRPPHGILSTADLLACSSTGLHPILWSCWGKEWLASSTPRSVLAELRKELRGGATVLLHDSDFTSAVGSWRSSLGALSGLAEMIEQMGLRTGPLYEHWSCRHWLDPWDSNQG